MRVFDPCGACWLTLTLFFSFPLFLLLLFYLSLFIFYFYPLFLNFFTPLFSFFHFLAMQNQNHPWYGMICCRVLTDLPHTWTFVSHNTKSQVHVWCQCLLQIVSNHQVCIWCSSHILGHRMPFVLSISTLKWLATKTYPRVNIYYPDNTFLLLLF